MKNLKLLAMCVGAAYVPSLAAFVSTPLFYSELKQPLGSPPSWVFAPVWTTLYAMIGWAHFEYSKETSGYDKTTGHRLQVAQLVLNATWSLAFFGLRNPKLALLNIVLLWIAIFFTMRAFGKVSKRAQWLMLPYLLWVSFATYLNAGIVALNPEL